MLTDFNTSPTSLETQTSMEETSSLTGTSHGSKPIGIGSTSVARKDSNNNSHTVAPSLARSLSNSISTSPSFLNSPKEALQRFFFGYHSKTKRSLTEEAECGDEFSVQSWTKAGVDPNTVDEYGYTPLLNASVLGRLNAVVELVKVGADVNKKGSFGFTPLHAAAQVSLHFSI
jgi:ankyrin repeat protein